MVKRIIFLTLIISLLFSSACGKLGTKSEYPIEPDVRAYFQYSNGSKWNYVSESDTNLKETTQVEAFKEGKMVWDMFSQQFFECNFVSTRDSVLKLRAIADDVGVSRAIFLVKDTVYKITAEFYYTGGKFRVGTNTGDSIQNFNAKNVFGIVYQDVMEVKTAKGAVYKSIWIAKNIGIIRKEFRNGRVMVLKSYALQ